MKEYIPVVNKVKLDNGTKTSVMLNPRYAFYDIEPKQTPNGKGLRLTIDLVECRVVQEEEIKYNNGIKGLRTKPKPVIGKGIPPEVQNSKINMLWIGKKPNPNKTTNPKEEHVSFISTVEVTEFDKGIVYYDTTNVRYALNTNTLEVKKDYEQTLRLHINNNDESVKLLHKTSAGAFEEYSTEVLTYDFIEDYLLNHFMRSWLFQKKPNINQELNVFTKLFIKHFFNEGAYIKLIESKGNYLKYDHLYHKFKVRSNTKLLELPWSSEELSSLYSSVTFSDFRYKHKSGAKYLEQEELKSNSQKAKEALKQIEQKVQISIDEAVNACFYNFDFPKVIKDKLICLPPLAFPPICFELLYEASQEKTIDNDLLAELVFTKEGEAGYRTIMYYPHLINALLKGVDCNTVAEYVRLSYASDSFNTISADDNYKISSLGDMFLHEKRLSKLKGLNIVKADNIDTFRYYTILSDAYQQFSKSVNKFEFEAMSDTSTSNQLSRQVFDGYTVRSPNTALEVVNVASTMGFALASQAHAYFHKHIEMAVVVDKADECVALITIDKNTVKSIKRHGEIALNNTDLYTHDDPVVSAINQWIKTNNYEVSLERFEEPIVLSHDDKNYERLEIVMDYYDKEQSLSSDIPF